jgi:hypothetical protein
MIFHLIHTHFTKGVSTMKSKLILALFLLCTMGTLIVSAQMTERTDAIWARTVPPGTLTLDGVLDEPAWAVAESLIIVYGEDAGMPGSGWRPEGGEVDPSDPTNAVLKLLVEDDYLYMGLVVSDSSIGGSQDWATWDAVLMNIRDRLSPNRPTPAVEYFYTWWGPDWYDTTTTLPGEGPQYFGRYAARDIPENVENWDAVTVVRGWTNDDSVVDTSYTIEMRFKVDVVGYDTGNPEGEIIEWNISIWDADWNWPRDEDKYSSNRVWWQSPWGNTNFRNHVRVMVHPAITHESGPVPPIPPDGTIPNGQDFAAPNIDGFLDDEVWEFVPGFEIRFGDDDLRDEYPTTGPYRSGQFQIEIDGGRAEVLDPADATIKAFFKDNWVYVGIDVLDQVVVGTMDNRFQDGVRLTIDDRVARDPDEYRLLVRNLTVLVDSVDGYRLSDYLPFLVDSLEGALVGLQLKDNTVINDPAEPDEGYTIEVAIDLTKLGYPEDRGDGILFAGVTIFDGDKFENPADDYGTITWWFREHDGGDGPAWIYMDPTYLITTSVTDDPSGFIPERFTLLGNYPNPFNPSTTILYAMPEAGTVVVFIYDVLGRTVARLDAGYQSAGQQHITFDATGYSSGIYYYRAEMTSQSDQKILSPYSKMVLIK